MAALSGITAVRPTLNTQFSRVQYGATVGVGQPLYTDSTASNKSKPADSNASQAAAAATCISLTPGVDTGYGLVATSGSIILVGTTMAVGMQYYVGPNAGEIVPASDLTTGHYPTLLGTAATTTQLDLSILATGIVRP